MAAKSSSPQLPVTESLNPEIGSTNSCFTLEAPLARFVQAPITAAPASQLQWDRERALADKKHCSKRRREIALQ
jgi:hypothetical protein